MASGKEGPIEDWTLNHTFDDPEGDPITCNRRDTCGMGSYLLYKAMGAELHGPACQPCEFTGDLDDVFNPDEPRFKPGAPENYKTAAARVLTQKSKLTFSAIKHDRPDTAATIETYVKGHLRSVPDASEVVD